MKKPNASFDVFAKLDIRVGEVMKAEPIEGSTKLLALVVDLGDDYKTVEILAGVGEYYKPEELTGNKFLFIANLEPRPMMGRVSNGMMLAADEDRKPILLPVAQTNENGTQIR